MNDLQRARERRQARREAEVAAMLRADRPEPLLDEDGNEVMACSGYAPAPEE